MISSRKKLLKQFQAKNRKNVVLCSQEVSERKSPRHVMKRQVGRGGNLSGCKNEQLRETIRNMLEPLLKRLKLKLGDVAKVSSSQYVRE